MNLPTGDTEQHLVMSCHHQYLLLPIYLSPLLCTPEEVAGPKRGPAGLSGDGAEAPASVGLPGFFRV